MKKKQYLKPIVLFEDMDISDCILGVSNPGRTVIVNGPGDGPDHNSINPTVSNNYVNDQASIASKESDWSYDYTFDLDW